MTDIEQPAPASAGVTAGPAPDFSGVTKRGPGRPPNATRATEVRAQRRRRADTEHGHHGRLAVRKELLEPQFHHRWINDDPGRIHAMTVKDDFDKVSDPSLLQEDGKSMGAEVRQLVGTHLDGKPKYAYLCRKPLDFHREDRAKKQRVVDEMEADIKRGIVKSPGALSADNPRAYVPGGAKTPMTMADGSRRTPQTYTP